MEVITQPLLISCMLWTRLSIKHKISRMLQKGGAVNTRVCESTALSPPLPLHHFSHDCIFQTKLMPGYLVWRDITVHLSGPAKVTSIPVSHQTWDEKHLSSCLKKLPRVNVCTSVLTQLCCHELPISAPEALGEGKKKKKKEGKGLNSSQKWDFNFLEIPICLCMCAWGSGRTEGRRGGVEDESMGGGKNTIYPERRRELESWLSNEQQASSDGDCLWKLQVIMSSGNQCGL